MVNRLPGEQDGGQANKLMAGGIVFYKHNLQFIIYFNMTRTNSVHASGDFCRLLITFANSLDPDQDRQHVGPDVDPICLTLW